MPRKSGRVRCTKAARRRSGASRTPQDVQTLANPPDQVSPVHAALAELARHAGTAYATVAMVYLEIPVQPSVIKRILEAAERLRMPLPPLSGRYVGPERGK